MTTERKDACCPEFDPGPWKDKELEWRDRLFVRDRVRSFLHIPLNFGAVMTRGVAALEAAGARPDPMLVLSDENSLWGADVYLEATRDVPGARMARISGTFLSKVFEGPYRNMGTWIREMQQHVKDKGRELRKLYFYYTTCPKCAKKHGKNYVVLLAQV
ncbi:MAG: hypothetical protein KA248_09830 [Kiritimatiellae bacterium]|nr:hypothetical protein [Kiritimatiellia bacterium]